MKNKLKNIKLLNKAIFIEDKKILVLSDIHIGYEESLNKQGILIPRTQFQDTICELQEILNQLPDINKIIILGDLKHEFGEISVQEWRETLRFLELLEQKTKNIVLIKGNHDTILGPIARKKNMELKDFHQDGEYFFAHGDKFFDELFEKEVTRIFLGHIHPAIILHEGAKTEKYKCFLVGNYKNKTIIILPSFLPLIEGTDSFNKEEKIFGKIKVDNFKVYAVEEKVFELGKRKNL